MEHLGSEMDPNSEDLESETEDLQCIFESLIQTFQESFKKLGIPLETLKAQILKWRHISKSFALDIAKAKNIDTVFDHIRTYSRWFQIELFSLITEIPALKETVCLKSFEEYKTKLRRYFEVRIEQPMVKSETEIEALILPIDNAWDKRLLVDHHCKKTCKQICMVLGKEGRIGGHLDGGRLYILIS